MDENISRAAGAAHGQRMDVAELEEIVGPSAGRLGSAPPCTRLA